MSVLCFVVVTAFLLLGMASVVVSYYQRVRVEGDYAGAMNLAEAGANWELQQISAGDAAGTPSSPTSGYISSAIPGTYQCYCTNRNAPTTPWTVGSAVDIYGVGTVDGISRKVKFGAMPITSTSVNIPNDALLTNGGTLILDGGCVINGSLGTNGSQVLTFNGSPNTVNGNITFYGLPNGQSGWQNAPNPCPSSTSSTTPVTIPTVESIATTLFPSGGLTYVAAHNDNGLASPPITNPDLLVSSGTQTFVGKAGGANYYLTNLTCNGGTQIYFNNAAGPINIWIGPTGGSTTVNFYGGTASNPSDTTRPVVMFVATTNDIQQNGNATMDMAIYNVNASGGGRILLNGSNVTVNGQLVGQSITANGPATVNYINEFASSGSYYGYDKTAPWVELSPIH
jgi:hypothetical protein